MDDETIHELKAQINANTRMIRFILSGLLDNDVQFENVGFEEYKPDFTYGLDEKHEYGHSVIGKMATLEVCKKTSGEYDFKTGKCIHEKEKM